MTIKGDIYDPIMTNFVMKIYVLWFYKLFTKNSSGRYLLIREWKFRGSR